MIEAEGLTKQYGAITAVHHLSFQIAAGEIVGLLGPNGAGKTTTLRLITGFMPPTAGQVRIASYDIFNEAREAKRQIGYLPEQPPLYPELTVDEYLRFVVSLHGVPRERCRHAIETAVERTELGPMRRRLIGQLSRGYQQRVGLAQVLAREPKVLILDEPTVGLDPKQITQIRTLIKGLAGDYTVVLSSHILQEVSATCDRVIIIHQGEIVAQDTEERLMERVRGGKVFRLVLKGVPVAAAQEKIAALPSVTTAKVETGADESITLVMTLQDEARFHEDLFCLLKSENWVPYALSEEATTLEEVFLKLTES